MTGVALVVDVAAVHSIPDLGRAAQRLAATIIDAIVERGPVLAATAGLGFTLLAVVRLPVRRLRHRRLWRGARLVTVLAPPQVDRDGAAALWRHLAGLLRPTWRRALFGQPHLTFEYRITAAGAQIQMWVPGSVAPGLIERAVASAWPGATTRTAPIPHPAATGDTGAPRRVTTGGTLRLARTSTLPIDDAAPGDPVAAMLAAAGDITPHPDDTDRHTESAPDPALGARDATRGQTTDETVVQVLARPAPVRRASNRPAGPAGVLAAVVTVTGSVAAATARELLALATPGPITPRQAIHRPAARSSTTAGGDPRQRLERSSGDRAAVTKARGAVFETLVRYVATSHYPLTGDAGRDADAARHALATARGRAGAAATVFASFTAHNFYRRRRLHRPDHAVARRHLGRGDVLSVTELAAIATLPTGPAPGLTRAGARAVAPPPGIPTPGPDVKPIGDTTASTHQATTGTSSGRPVGIRVADARHHLHVIGATGSGKSTLLVQMILADIRHRRGVVVIDPKGDLVTDIWNRLPHHVRARTVLIDPDRPGPPPNLNPLALPAPAASGNDHPAGTADQITARHARAVENLVAICRGVYSAYWGPRTDDLLRAACLTLITAPGPPRSLTDLPDLLTDPDVRARLTRALRDPVLIGFWTDYERLPETARAQVIAPLMNKIRALLLRPFTRAVLTSTHPSRPDEATGPLVDMPGVLDGGVLLARIPKGTLGEEGTRLIGSIIVAHAWAATTARAARAQHLRRDASLVIDECHNFLHIPVGIDDLLAEARGLRLGITLAHQNLDQLPPGLRAGIATNARNKVFFTVGPDDARDLAGHTVPQLDAHDLSHLDAFHAAVRLVHHDAETPAFTIRTRPLPPAPARTDRDRPASTDGTAGTDRDRARRSSPQTGVPARTHPAGPR